MRKKVSFVILVNKGYDRSKNLRRGIESTFIYWRSFMGKNWNYRYTKYVWLCAAILFLINYFRTDRQSNLLFFSLFILMGIVSIYDTKKNND